ncbi:MAG: hypothetical protein ABI477_20710 [Chryseolinea sp.]
MQRRNQFITAMLTAALTFGVLTFALGQRHYGAWHGQTHGNAHDHHHNHCDEGHVHEKENSSENEL